MGTVRATKENFEELVTGNRTVLVDFWASWCGPCRVFAPVFEQAARDHPGVVFAKVDTEAEPELAAAFQVKAIPTLVVLQNQAVVYAQPGALPPAALEKVIARVEGPEPGEVHGRASAAGA